MLKLKLQGFGHLMQRVNSLERTLMPGKIEDRRRREWKRSDGWMASLTLDMGLSKLQEMVKDREAWHTAVHGVTESHKGHDWVTEQQQKQQPLWRYFKKIKIELPYNPAIPFPGTYSKKRKTLIRKDMCTLLFIAGLCTIAKILGKPKCLSIDEWIKIMW